MKVRSWMTEAVETIHPGDVLQMAAEKMEQGRFRRMPVVDENAGGHPERARSSTAPRLPALLDHMHLMALGTD